MAQSNAAASAVQNLFRTPERCSGTWSYELTVGSKRSKGRIPCQATL